MRPRVKICGITNVRDALLCAGAGAEYLGFIFYEKSPRRISVEAAGKIIRELPHDVIPVGVFVNAPRKSVEDIAAAAGIRLLQFSGDEPPEACAGHALPVWKSFRIRDPGRVTSVAEYHIDAALLDGAGDGEYGGSGKLADAEIARNLKQYHPLILAGGLTPENIRSAVSAVRPFAIDVNSGVEVSPGIKDEAKVHEIFRQLNSTK